MNQTSGRVCATKCSWLAGWLACFLAGSQKTSAVLVASPFITLTVDQVETLRKRGMKSAVITSQSGITCFRLTSFVILKPCSSRWRDALDKPAVSERNQT